MICLSLRDANGEPINIGDTVVWTDEALERARTTTDPYDGCLVLPGEYKVVRIDSTSVWITPLGIPCNPQSLRVVRP